MDTSHLCLHQTVQPPNTLAHFLPLVKQTHPFPKRSHPESHSVSEPGPSPASTGDVQSFPCDRDGAPCRPTETNDPPYDNGRTETG